jgi:intracellular multiplication protein IcmK
VASIDPGSTPAVIHLVPGYITAMSVVGRDGTPWPIVTESVGSSQQFDISSPAQAGGTQSNGGKVAVSNGAPSNLLTINPRFFGATSNLVLTLKGLDTPLVVMLESGSPTGTVVDGRVTLRVNRDAPDAPPPTVMAPPPSPVDTTLMSFLEGTPPKEAKTLPMDAVGVEGWSWNNSLIVKTRDTLVLPAWTAQVQQDGVSVYQIPMTGSITVREANGTMMNIVTGGQK